MPINGQIGERLRQPAGPRCNQTADERVVSQPEVQDRLAARENSARQDELAHLDAQGTFDPDGGADPETVGDGPAQVDGHAVARVAVIAEKGDAFLVIRVNQIEIAIAVQIAERRAKADALLVETPVGAHIFECQIAQIAIGEMGLDHHGTVPHDAPSRGRRLGAHLSGEQVDIGGLPVHAVGHKEVETAIIV